MKKLGMKSIILAFVSVFTLAALRSFFVDTQSVWFQTIAKPAFLPPYMVYTLVWIALYLLLAFSLARTVALSQEDVAGGKWMFLANFVLTALWSFVFFVLHSTLGGLIVGILLTVQTIFLIRALLSADKWAAIALLPYALWLSASLVVNYVCVMIN